jgi:hypothetical protein
MTTDDSNKVRDCETQPKIFSLLESIYNSPDFHPFEAQHKEDETEEEEKEVDNKRYEQFKKWCEERYNKKENKK